MLRSLRRIKDIHYSQEEIDSLFKEKQKLKNKKTSREVFRELMRIQSSIDYLLFVPEIISVVIEDNRHYDSIIRNGLFINNRKYVRLLCGAGNARRDTVIFVAQDFEAMLKEVLNNDRKDIPLVPAKLNAYFALCSSATLSVREPSFCVIKDCVVSRKVKVDFVEEMDGQDDIIEEKEIEAEANLFDGMGIISPEFAMTWAGDLGLDYVPSTFIIRNIFLKGMVCVMDFHAFAQQRGEYVVQDVWGDYINIRDIDIILTESQFKLWNAYNSCKDYVKACNKNGMLWGISRYAPKEENAHVFSNYQFLQVLDLDDDQIARLCEKTIEYFSGIIGKAPEYTLLYLLGKSASKSYDPDLFGKIYDNITKAILLDNKLISDPYIQKYIVRSLNKRIKKSYIGNLLLDGNYQIMINDPYAFMEYMFGMEPVGLLKEGRHYSNYWNEKHVDVVAACRAPLTWRSEVNVLNLEKDAQIKHWYRHIKGGIIYNIHGNDNMLHADSDMDGDIVMTTNCQEIIDGCYGGLPITYNLNKINKEEIDESKLWEVDKKAFHTKIGFITNCSTTLYAMLPQYDRNSKERNAIIDRLKICRKEQGNQIDKSKGLLVKPFPKHWTKWQKVSMDMSEEEVERARFNNKIIIDKRPYFMRWLYANYNRDYRKHYANYDFYCICHFGKTLEIMLADKNLSEREQSILNEYFRFSPLLDSDCVMNKICHHMESEVSFFKEEYRPRITEKNILKLKNAKIPVDKEKLKKLYDLYKKYKNEKRNFAKVYTEDGETKFKTLEQYNKAVRHEAYKITSNISELANLAVAICYELHPADTKTFAWGVFGEGIVSNIVGNNGTSVLAPFLDEYGDIEYLGNTYSMMSVSVGAEFYADF